MLTYVVSHDPYVSLFLRERHSSILEVILDDALDLEGNILASRMLAYSYIQSLKESGCGQESKASPYAPNLVDSCLQESLIMLPTFEENETETFILS
jgi:hypothetical protein